MTPGESLVLAVILVAFVGFAAALAWASRD